MNDIPEPNNLKIFSDSKAYLKVLTGFGVIEKGHMEYKKVAEDGRHYHGEYYINFRNLTTDQELALVPFYLQAIEHWFGARNDFIVMGVAMGSLMLPKVIQLELFKRSEIEYAYAEKRNGVLGIFDEQAKKCQGKHLLFIEDVCNNGTSAEQLKLAIDEQKIALDIKGYSLLYGVHRGHTFLASPENEIYAMGIIYAPAYAPDEGPPELKNVPLKLYKK